MIAIAVGTGVGMNALISKRLGLRRVQDANIAAGNGFFLLILSSLVFVVTGLVLPRFMM